MWNSQYKVQQPDKGSCISLHLIHLRAYVITHNDLLYTQKTHIAVDAPSIVQKYNLFIYKQSLETFIVPSMSADVHFAKSVLTLSWWTIELMWWDGFDRWRSGGQDLSFGVGFLNCRNQSYRMIHISAFQFPQRHILTTTISADASLPFMCWLFVASVFGSMVISRLEFLRREYRKIALCRLHHVMQCSFFRLNLNGISWRNCFLLHSEANR